MVFHLSLRLSTELYIMDLHLILSDIEPWTFEQHPGEAVIIPAGCPYQVRKLKVVH